MDVRVTQRRRLGSAVRSVAVMVVASLSVSASYGGLGRAVFASAQKEGEAVRKAGRSVTRLVTDDMKLESTTTNLERTLKDAGLNVELQRGELPSIGIDVTLDRKPIPPAPKDPP